MGFSLSKGDIQRFYSFAYNRLGEFIKLLNTEKNKNLEVSEHVRN